MSGFLKIEQAIDTRLLDDLKTDIESKLVNYSKTLKHLGGLRSGHLNATIGRYASILHKELMSGEIYQEIEKNFKIDLNNYSVTVGCNLNFPGSIEQHIHRDTNFDDRKIIINIPCVDVNEINGSIELFLDSELCPYSYLEFLMNRKKFKPIRANSNKGDILIRDSNLFHRGMPNYSDQVRVMVAFVFNKKLNNDNQNMNTEFPQNIEFFENWYKNDRLGRIKEILFIKLPIIRSLYRIIKSLYKPRGAAT